jgi:Spy/CpxP family protein refolding chaperone
MKTRIFLKYTLLATALFGASALQLQAQAADNAARRPQGVLTQDQRTKMREAMDTAETTKLAEKLAAAQKEAVKAALAENADEKTVRAKLEAVTKIQTEMMALRFKGVKAIASSLTDEQKTQLESAPGGGFMQLFSPMGGGGGRGGRRGGAGGGQNN